MLKKKRNSIININKNLSTNSSKKRVVNKTPSKIVFPNRTNLTLANIIVHMNSIPCLNIFDSCDNSYFNTELYNNSSSRISPKNNINDFSINKIETKDYHSEILPLIINGILSLKSNDSLNYCIQLIEIITFIRDRKHKNNYIDINSKINKDLLMIIYKIFFRIFPEKSSIYQIIKNDLKNGKKIFKTMHSIYILYLLCGLSYNNSKSKKTNPQLYIFLKKFIKKEICTNIKCPLCNNIDIYEKDITNLKKSHLIIIKGLKYKKKNCINTEINYGQKIIKNKINISKDNIISKKTINNTFIKKDDDPNIFLYLDSSKNKLKKKLNYTQIINANEIEKSKFFTNSSKKKNRINGLEKIHNIYCSARNSKNKNLKAYGNKMVLIKKKLNKNNNTKFLTNLKEKIKNKISNIDLNDNNNNNNKISELSKSSKISLKKNTKIKINILTDFKDKNQKQILINLDDSEKKDNININDPKDKELIKGNVKESSKIIKENITLMEKEIIVFKEHNLRIKKELDKILTKNKEKKDIIN